jgi:hypothetical protein
MNDEQDVNPESTPSANPPTESPASDEDLRYAPPVEDASTSIGSSSETWGEPVAEDTELSVTEGLDIEAALAAVSSLSDLMAEQEAAEQTRIAQEEAEAKNKAEHQARLDNPERFFPVPPLTPLHRGQLSSVVPAVLLMLIGAWLTFSLTTKAIPNTELLAVIGVGSLALTLLTRWLGSGRWARGSLFFALVVILCSMVGGYLVVSNAPDIGHGWPLFIVALGLAIIISALLSRPVDRHLIFPGLLVIVIGAAGLVISLNVLSSDLLALTASLWPAAVIAIILLWLLPVIFRQRQ